MLLGMMVVGTSAASYKDVDSKNNLEAIEVLKAVGVMTGDEKGNFNPDKMVTRNEMAVVMTNLLGLKAGGSHPFKDVPTWAAPYVAACYNNGIIAGVSADKFNGDANVTAVQAGLMVMKALGYFGYQGEFGDSWKLSVVKQANEIDLYKGINAYTDQDMTRNEVAQMVLNALQATVMVVREQGGMSVEGNGIIVTEKPYYTKTAADNKSGKHYSDEVSAGDYGSEFYTMQLCEKLYGDDLKKFVNYADGDDFGRPATKWTYGADSVVSPKANTLVYTAEKKLSEVDKDMKDYKYLETAIPVVVNGFKTTAVVSDESIKNLTGNGVVVEIYTNNKNEVTNVVAIKSYLAKVTSVSDKNEEITLDYVKANLANVTTDKGYGTYKKNDYVMVTPKYGVADTLATGTAAKVLAITEATKVSGKVTAVVTDKSATIDGETYKKAAIYSQDTFNPQVSNVAIVDAYVDAYGYLVDCNASTAAGNYMYVARFWGTSKDDYGYDVNKVQGVLTDGTIGSFTVTNTSADLGLYSYTISDGKYTLTPAAATNTTANYGHSASATIESSTVKLNSHYFAEDVNFISVSGTPGSDLKTKVYTGKQNMSGSVTVYYLTSKSITDSKAGTITTAFVVGSDVVTVDSDLIYSTGATSNGQVYIDGTNYNTYELYVNGEKKTLPVKGSTTPAANEFYTYGVDANGVYSLTEKTGSVVNSTLTTVYNGYVTLNDTLTAGNYDATDAIVVDTRSGDPDPEMNSLSALSDALNAGKTITVSVAYDSNDKEISIIYVLTVA